MRVDPPVFQFEVIAEDLARLTVHRQSGLFGARTTPSSTAVGFYDAPLFRFEHPYWSGDEAWSVTPCVEGRRVCDDLETADDWTLQYDLWRAGSRAVTANGVLARLPSGEYLLARSPISLRAPSEYLLGNSMQTRADNVRVLHSDGPVYSCVIGADSNAPPPLNRPLIGLVALDYTGGSALEHLDGVIFFSFGADGGDDPGEGREAVLVVPTAGELVLGGDEASNEGWRTVIGPAYAARCTGSITGNFGWRELQRRLGKKRR